MSAGPDIDTFTAGLDYPMFIVTVAADDPGAPVPGAPGPTRTRSGCLVGFSTQCSIDPPRFLVCISKANHTYPLAHGAAVLGVHVLDAGQHRLAELFGGRTGDDVDKFAACAWRDGPGGAPILTDCPHWLVGEVHSQVDLGDHVGFCLAPIAIGARTATDPLTFAQVQDLQPGHPA